MTLKILRCCLEAALLTILSWFPTSDDVMLNYQTNSYHDAVAIREILNLHPIDEFERWLEKMGIMENGKLTKKAGDPTIFIGR